jgi:hypothetical protein
MTTTEILTSLILQNDWRNVNRLIDWQMKVKRMA